MSMWLSQSSLMAPVPPAWLESLCQRLADNDPALVTVELANMHRVDDVYSKVFARALQHNHTCTALIISLASIVDDGPYAIASVLAKHKSIQKVQIRDGRNHREITILLDNIRSNHVITELSFRHCQICPRSATAIQEYVQSNPNLQEMRLVDCQLLFDPEASMEHLARGFQHGKSLKRVYLVNMELDPPAAKHIGALLTHPQCQIQEIHLAENNLGDDGVALLAQAIPSNRSLRLLDLRSNAITEHGAMSLQGMLTRSVHLRHLCLSHNELGPMGAAALARGLQRSCCKLTTLQLSENSIGNEGTKRLADMLRVNKTLTELDLSMNDVGNDGADNIALALAKNRTLRSINLRRNAISDTGALVFAKHLIHMHGLKELMLNKNKISQDGGLALLQALQSNTEIEYLTAAEDSISDRRMIHWFRLNRAGRRIFKHHNVPCALWSKIYGNVSDDAASLYFFVRARPEAVPTITNKTS